MAVTRFIIGSVLRKAAVSRAIAVCVMGVCESHNATAGATNVDEHAYNAAGIRNARRGADSRRVIVK